jgi:hypothetical protein
MAFYVYTRYGAQERYQDDSDISSVVDRLLEELETEEFEEPDDEHTEVSLTWGNWYVAVNVSGLITLGNNSWITGKETDVPAPTLHMRASSRSEVSDLLNQLARGEVQAVRSASWMPMEKLPPRTSDFFRGAEPGLTNG